MTREQARAIFYKAYGSCESMADSDSTMAGIDAILAALSQHGEGPQAAHDAGMEAMGFTRDDWKPVTDWKLLEVGDELEQHNGERWVPIGTFAGIIEPTERYMLTAITDPGRKLWTEKYNKHYRRPARPVERL